MARIAFLGTGLMGAPMVRNLLKAGHELAVWNRTTAKAKALEADGARVACDPADAVVGTDFVITMLSDGKATAQIVWDSGMADALSEGAVLIDMSSASRQDAETLAARMHEKGFAALDAPVSGGTKGASDGSLAIMVGGEKKAFERAMPVLAVLGRPVRVGPAGTGQLAKLINQTIVAAALGAVAEATALAEAGGADPAAVRQALAGGFADSIVLQQHGERMQRRNFEPGGPSKHHLKDLRNTRQVADDLGLTLPLLDHLLCRYDRLCDQLDGGDKDHAAIFLELMERNGKAVQ
ncbi:MAG: NAD(P)-dependent oxidoreductase [Pseudomonadota bacterium]